VCRTTTHLGQALQVCATQAILLRLLRLLHGSQLLRCALLVLRSSPGVRARQSLALSVLLLQQALLVPGEGSHGVLHFWSWARNVAGRPSSRERQEKTGEVRRLLHPAAGGIFSPV
jgi:hypothetical protein